MSSDLVIHAKPKDLGGFSVARSLPSMQKRAIGPFVFLDHMGPMKVDSEHLLSVRPHPHIGLATVTYLFSGRGHHRDSLGSDQIISSGDINLMVAGQGIVHSERTPAEDLDPTKNVTLHGVQIWVALPIQDEKCEPSFFHYPKAQLPLIKISDNLSLNLLIGQYQNTQSPVKSFSPTFFAELLLKQNQKSTTLSFEYEEIGLFVIEGEVTINNQALAVNDLISVADSKNIQLSWSADARLVVVGGTPFKEPRYMWWNFVASDKNDIREAAKLWQSQHMGQVAGESDFIPLPTDPLP